SAFAQEPQSAFGHTSCFAVTGICDTGRFEVGRKARPTSTEHRERQLTLLPPRLVSLKLGSVRGVSFYRAARTLNQNTNLGDASNGPTTVTAVVSGSRADRAKCCTTVG